MKVLFTFFIMFVLLIIEVYSGKWGFFLPFYGLGVFYFTVNFGFKYGVICALLGGMVIDLLFGRNWCFAVNSLVLVVCLGEFWRRKQDVKPWGINIVPGALTGMICLSPFLVYLLIAGEDNWVRYIDFLALIFTDAVIMGVSFLLLVLLLDALCFKLGLEKYMDIRSRKEI